MSGAPRLENASVRLDSMPIGGRDIEVRPDAEARAVLAGDLKITAVEDLEVRLHAVKFRGGIRVTGRLTASIVQPSVISLEPVTQLVSEPIDRIFLPGSEKRFAEAAGAEVFVDLEGDDVPDHFDGPEADLSDLIIETLALGIDPYPRAEGESAEALGLPTDAGKESPFAVLKALKDKQR